uniref:Disease resistance N-terminal domain-containing protein n=1 Tax=Chenopodium quinoa TaxID=63459 RepID=A0A803MJG8_CHEQI
MMAEAIMAEVVSVIVEKLGSRAYKEILFAKDLDSHIKRLQKLKTTIEATFLDAASLESWSNAQLDVLDKLNNALAELDDFLD